MTGSRGLFTRPTFDSFLYLEKKKKASIACGGFHTAAVTTDGDCYTWGKEDYGMLGCSNEALLQVGHGEGLMGA